MRTKDELSTYFDEVIDRIVYPEIERCIKSDARYIAALALLSYTEFIGALINGHLGSRGTSECDFNAALEYFPTRYWDADSELKVEYVDGNGVKLVDKGIYSLFRCGLAHEVLIKGNSGIVNDPNWRDDNTRIGVTVMSNVLRINKEGECEESEEKILVFYVNEYFRDFKMAVEKIRERLFKHSDTALLERFDRGLDIIFSRKIS